MALLRYRYWSLVGLSLATEIAGFLLTGQYLGGDRSCLVEAAE